MILERDYHLILEGDCHLNQYSFAGQREDQIHCAFDETFVLFINSSFLIHVDKDGKVLRRQDLQRESFMTMVSDHQVIITDRMTIRLIDLRGKNKDKTIIIEEKEKEKQVESSQQQQYFQIYSMMETFFFQETNLFCIAKTWHRICTQKKENIKQSYKTYFQITYLKLSSIYSETISNKIVQEIEYNVYCDLRKADNSSSFSVTGWQKSKQTRFDIISIDKIQKFLCSRKKSNFVTNIWRKSQDEFFLQQSYSASLFIANIALQSITQEILFPFQGELYPCTHSSWEIFFFGKFFLRYCDGIIYFEIFNYDMKKLKFELQNPKYQNQPYDGTFMTSWKVNKNQEVLVKKTKYISMQDEYMQMLLHLNEDFDDDFLLDAMNQLLFGVSE